MQSLNDVPAVTRSWSKADRCCSEVILSQQAIMFIVACVCGEDNVDEDIVQVCSENKL